MLGTACTDIVGTKGPVVNAPVPTPNSGPAKFIVAGLSLAAGTGGALALRGALASPERAQELRKDGVSVVDADAAAVKFAVLPFATAAGITLGLTKRGPTAGFTTAVTAGLGAVLTGTIGAFAKADSQDGKDQAVAVGAVGIAASAGALMGVRDEFARVAHLRQGSIGMFGVAVGLMAPMMVEKAGQFVGDLGRSHEYR